MTQKLPLQNISIVVTRPSHQSREICRQLNMRGAHTIAFPCIEIKPNDKSDANELRRQVQHSDMLIFISKNAVIHAYQMLPNLHEIIPNNCQVAAIGAATAELLFHSGINNVISSRHTPDSESLLALKALHEVKHKMILIIKGVGGRKLLYDTLSSRGADVHNIELYQRILPEMEMIDTIPLTNKIDLILFTSSEVANNFVTLAADYSQQLMLTSQTIVGHPRIAEKATNLGFTKKPIIAATPSDEDMLTAIHRWASSNLVDNTGP